MPTQDAGAFDEFWWANPQLKEALLRDPGAVLRDRGINIPDGLPPAIVHDFVRVAWLLWVDGALVPLDRFHIDPADEGLLFGRGVWESTRTVDGVPWLWPLHLERLRQTAQLLHIDVAPERLPDTPQVSAYVRALTTQDVIVRLNVTAGAPGKAGLVWLSAAPYPLLGASVRLRSCRNPVQKGQAYLALKTFHYAARLRLGQQAMQAGFDSALLLDDGDNLLEAAHANIFVRLPEGWATPTADGGLLPGTVRQHLLRSAPLPICERVVPYALLAEVREAFVTNSNVGIVPVVGIDAHHYDVGPETAALIQWLEPPARPGVQYRLASRVIVPR